MLHQEEVQIPLLVEGMTHGLLRRWLVESGDRVEIGQPIFEVETDGTVYEVESFDLGTITTTGIEGSSYKVGMKIGLLEFSEEERLEFEHFAVRLTHEMRQAIDEQRGNQSRNKWLQKAFAEFLASKIN